MVQPWGAAQLMLRPDCSVRQYPARAGAPDLAVRPEALSLSALSPPRMMRPMLAIKSGSACRGRRCDAGPEASPVGQSHQRAWPGTLIDL
jgi:hypothetical protein